MRKLLVLIAGLVAIVSLQAEVLTGISGRVIDARNQMPIIGAQIMACGPNGQGMARSDSAGFYQISWLREGVYIVHAHAQGYRPATYPDSVVVVRGQVTPNINFALEPDSGRPGGISGMVTNTQNQAPIPNALIVAHGPGHGEAHSGPRGDYLMQNLPPGVYAVGASAQGFHPSAWDTVVVQAGQVTPNVDFALEPCGGQTGGISGRVIDARTRNQRPIIGARIMARSPNGQGVAHSSQNGCYLISKLPDGIYVVTASARGYRPATYPDSVVVHRGQITPNINFALVPCGGQTGGISGIVTDARTSEPIFGALVIACGPSQGRGNSGRQGIYHIGNLRPGVYAVRAMARGFRPSAWDTVVVQAGQVTPDVDFALEPESTHTGGISGIVKDSVNQNPIVGAFIFAWGRGGQGRAISDSTGNYLISHLGPGPYLVLAMARGFYPAIYPGIVQVAAGQTTPNINFTLIRVRHGDAGIAGFVYDGIEQTEISGALVVATGPDCEHQAYTDSYGNYLIEGLEPGEYEITVTAEGFEPGSYSEPVLVETEVVTSFTNPVLYPLTGVQESPVPGMVTGNKLAVEPNPFYSGTNIRWQLKGQGHVTLRVFDNTGRVVRTLVDSPLESGAYSIVWDGKDRLGNRLAKGTYFCELWTNAGILTTKTLLLQ